MVKHIVLYTLKEGVEKAEAIRMIGSLLEPLVGKIPGTFHEKLQDEGFLRLITADGGAICEKLGSTKVLNVVLLGIAAASGVLGIGTETIAGVIRARLPEKFHEINIRALNAGTNV